MRNEKNAVQFHWYASNRKRGNEKWLKLWSKTTVWHSIRLGLGNVHKTRIQTRERKTLVRISFDEERLFRLSIGYLLWYIEQCRHGHGTLTLFCFVDPDFSSIARRPKWRQQKLSISLWHLQRDHFHLEIELKNGSKRMNEWMTINHAVELCRWKFN